MTIIGIVLGVVIILFYWLLDSISGQLDEIKVLLKETNDTLSSFVGK